MKLKIRHLVIFFCLVFWSVSLFLANTHQDFQKYFLPSVLVAFSFFLYSKKYSLFLLPLIIIPFIEPKLAAFPLVASFLFFLLNKEKRNIALLLVFSIVIVFNWKAFWGQTIFTIDNDEQQEVIGKAYLYPSVLTARIFQNKPHIYFDKFSNNFFELTDPNNYFFGFHPREIKIENQNLKKFPALSLVFALFGFYYLFKSKHSKFIIAFLVGSILSLSILEIYDRNDFILWIPISLVIIHGFNSFGAKFKHAKYYYLVFMIFSSIEVLKIFIK